MRLPCPRALPAVLALVALVACSTDVGSQSGSRAPGRPAATGAATQGSPPTYYVSPHGDDDDAGSRGRPWRTLEHALEQLRPGETLTVRGGTYDEDVNPELTPGTPQRRITVRGEPGERPVVKGLVRLARPDHWTVRDLEITWGGGTFDDHMVKVSGGDGWVLDRVRIHGSRSRAGLLIAKSVTGGAPRNYVLRNSMIYNSTKGANLYLNPGLDARNGLIERNLFFGSPTENVKVGFGGSCRSQRDDLFGVADVVVRYNTLADAREPLTIAEPADDIEVYRNIVVDTREDSLVRLSDKCGNLGGDISIHDNLGAAAKRWCEEHSSPVTCEEVDDGGNVFPRDPDFDKEAVDGFRPQDPEAARYGRYAPG